MTITGIIVIAANMSLAMTMLCAGMGGLSGDATYLIRRRGLLARSLLAMAVLQPAFAVWLCFKFDIRPAAKLAMLAMSISPMPPILPSGLMKVRGARAFEVSLAFITSLLAIALVPVSLWLFGLVLAAPLRIDLVVATRLAATSILLPLGVGFGMRRLSPDTSRRAVTPLTLAAAGLLALVLVALVAQSWRGIRLLFGNGTVLAVVVLVLVGLVIGHVCGGPARKHRRVLAMATVTRHPALAIAIATTAFPNDPLVGVVIVLTVLLAVIASIPYVPLSRISLPRM